MKMIGQLQHQAALSLGKELAVKNPVIYVEVGIAGQIYQPFSRP
jgi:hypothetical protein